VAQAAIDSGVATRLLHDLDRYRDHLRSLATTLAQG
jgi:hypothetical protein